MDNAVMVIVWKRDWGHKRWGERILWYLKPAKEEDVVGNTILVISSNEIFNWIYLLFLVIIISWKLIQNILFRTAKTAFNRIFIES